MSALPMLLGLFVVLGAIVYVGIQAIEPALIYRPDRVRTQPQEVGLEGVQEVEIDTPDANAVLAWWSRAAAGRPTVLYFHGNGGSLANRADRIARFQRAGIGVFMMTYRGYGGSMGKPNERDNVRDGRRAFDYLIAAGLKPDDIVVFGESLGTGVAVQVVKARQPRGLILDSPYTSMLDLARLHYPYLPADWLLNDRYDTMAYIGDVHVPLLIVHGGDDRVVPVEMGRAVLAAAGGPREMLEVPGAPHVNHEDFGTLDAIFAWIARLYGVPPGA